MNEQYDKGKDDAEVFGCGGGGGGGSTVWEALGQVLMGLDKILLQSPSLRSHFSQFASRLVKPAAQRVGWNPKDSDGHLGKLLRATLISLLGLFCHDDEEVIALWG